MSPQRSKSCYHVALSENKGSAQVWIVSKWIFSPQQVLVTQSKVTNNRVLLEGMQTCSTGWSAVHVCFGQTWTGWHKKTQSSNGALRNRETRHLALQFSFDFVFDKLQTEIDHSNFSRLAFKWTELCVVHIHTEKYYSLTDGGNKWQYQYIRYCNLWSE